MDKAFTITSFAWRKEIADKLQKAGLEAQDDATIAASLVALARFLEERSLTNRKLLENEGLVEGQEFVLRSSDLTERGIAVIRGGFGVWEEKGYPATDLRSLEKAYNNIEVSNRKKSSERGRR